MTAEIPKQGRHRTQVSAEVNRMTVVAEAKILVHQLDEYLTLMGEWLENGLDGDDAGAD
jgi:hypothetical protein